MAVILEGAFYSLRAAALTFPAALPLLALPGIQPLMLRCAPRSPPPPLSLRLWPFGRILSASAPSALRPSSLRLRRALPSRRDHPAGHRCYLQGFRTAEALRQMPALPLLLLHGTDDDTVPIQHAAALWEEVGRARREARERLEAQGGVVPPPNSRLATPPAEWPAPCRIVALAGCDHLHATFEPSILAHLGAFLREASAYQLLRHSMGDEPLREAEPPVASLGWRVVPLSVPALPQAAAAGVRRRRAARSPRAR